MIILQSSLLNIRGGIKMEELEANLREILEEKTKIVPENIKSGVTIFGVTGTYTG